MPQRKGGGEAVQLGELLEALGPGVLSPIALPQGLDVDFHRVVVAEPGAAIEPGDLVVLLPQAQVPGVIAGLEGQLRWIRVAADGGAAAVVFKPAGSVADDNVRIVGEATDVAVLGITDSVSWHRALVLISAAVEAYGLTGGPSGDDFLRDLFTLADATSMAVGGAVAIMDGYSRIVAYSSQPGQPIDEVRTDGILGRKVPPEFVRVHADTRTWKVGEVRRIEVPGTLPRLAAPVRAGDAFLGSVWVIVPPGGATSDMTSTVSAAARTAAVHLLRYASTASSSAWRVEQTHVLARLLGREPPARARHTAQDGPCVVLAVIARQDTLEKDAVLAERLVALVNLAVSGWQGGGCAVVDEAVYALLPLTHPHTEGDARALAETILRRSQDSLGLTVGVGVSSTNINAPRGKQESLEAAQWIAANGGGTGGFEDIRVQATLAKVSQLLIDHGLSLPAIDDIVAHDQAHDTEYARTLLVHLESGLNVATAAATLLVHPNTLRYRLRRLSELFDLSLDEPDGRLAAWLFLRLAADTTDAPLPPEHRRPSS